LTHLAAEEQGGEQQAGEGGRYPQAAQEQRVLQPDAVVAVQQL